MLSILIPAYNAERYIAAAIGSALAQDVPGGLEILVGDDGSTDATVAIVQGKMASHGCIRLIRMGSNQGVCATRNRLLAAVSPQADYITFLDADDVLVENAYGPGLQILQQRPAVQMTYGRYHTVPTHLLTQGRAAAAAAPATAGVSLSAGVFRRDLITRVGLFDQTLTHGEDADYLLRICEICQDIALHDEAVFYYRRHASNATLDLQTAKTAFLRVLLMHISRRRADPALHDGRGLFGKADPTSAARAMPYVPYGNSDYAVVIPAFNAAKTIVATLQSVLAQSVQPSQIIVIDDGSTDDTAALAQAMGPLVTVVSTPNRGSGAATTTGIGMVDAAIVATVDADDVWLPHKMERQLAALLDPTAGLDAVLSRMEPFGDTHLKTAAVETSGWTRSSLVIWVESFLRVGAVQDMGHGFGEMVDWFARARSAGLRFRLIEEPLALRRIHPDSQSFRGGAGQARDYLQVARRALERKRRQGG